MNMMGPVLLGGMTKLINEDKQVCIRIKQACKFRFLLDLCGFQ